MDDEDYWNTSETKASALSFDDEVISTRDILSLGPTAAKCSNDDSEMLLGNINKNRSILPLSKLINSKVLDLLLLAQSGNEPGQPSAKQAISCHMNHSVPTTLKRLVLNRTCCLHAHKTMQSKTELLDGACMIGDGNVILTVVLFLSKTLQRKLVYELLSSRQIALDHYISFLVSENKIAELTDLFSMLGRGAEAAMYQFQHAVKSSGTNIDILIKKLKNLQSNHFNEHHSIDVHSLKMLNNYIKLLEWQKCTNNVDLYNKTALQCLKHCCEKFWHEGSGKMMSPLTICQQQTLSPMQYDWTALNVHATLKNWDTVESLFTKKDWFGRPTTSSSIPLPTMISRLYELEAPQNVMTTFIMKLQNNEQRLEIAKQFKVHSVVIEAYTKNRDKTSLLAYKILLNPQSEEYFLAEQSLRDPTIKWKN